MQGKQFVLYIVTVVLCLTSCGHKEVYFPRNIAGVETEVVRFDRSLLNVRRESSMDDVRVLYDEYPEFMPIFVEDILGIPSEDTVYLAEALPNFLEDTVYGFRNTNRRVREVFADTKDIEDELNGAFSRLHYLYPDMRIPTVYFMVSGFNASIYFADADMVAVGLDMYLGSDYEYYNRVVYDYQKTTMRKECIACDVVSAWLFRNIRYTAAQNRLIDNMIYRGKIMYLLSLLFPGEKDYEVMGYTKDQWRWCEEHERAIWNLVMDKRDLFKTETIVLTSYLNDGPFTAEVSQDAPGRLGTWLGWRIAESYMRNNKDITLQSLMEDGDAQRILEQSYYNP